MRIDDFIIPLGILTYTSAVITLISGLLRVKLQIHKTEAFVTVALATLHAALVIYLKFF